MVKAFEDAGTLEICSPWLIKGFFFFFKSCFNIMSY